MKLTTFKNILLYAASMAALFLLLQGLQFQFLIIRHATDIYVTAVALLFTFLGIWLAKSLTRPKTKIVTETVVKEVVVYKPAGEPFSADTAAIEQLGISQREMEVLNLIAEGAANQEIADRLFVSLNTVKTHTSRLFEKLDVKRRTQAVEKARRLRLIP